MKWAYKIQTDINWSKAMFLVAWLYVALTLFEPTHTKDHDMNRWDDKFVNLLACELIILILLSLDFAVCFYHNFYDTVFRDSAFFNTESLISDDKTGTATETDKPEKLERKRRATLVDAPHKTSTKSHHHQEEQAELPKKSVLELSKDTFKHQRRTWLQNTRIFLKTFQKQFLLYKVLLLLLFAVDYGLYFRLYPYNPYRFSRYFRTILFPIYSKPTRRTLQAMFHSVKRIFDYLIFFFSIIFLYAFIAFKAFYDEDRTYYAHPFYDEYVSDFNSYGTIVNALTVLVTFDNYPLVMRPFYAMSEYYLLYFMPYIFVNILFFKPVPIAVVYDGFRVASPQQEKRSKLTVEDHLSEKEALFTCFLTLTQGQ